MFRGRVRRGSSIRLAGAAVVGLAALCAPVSSAQTPDSVARGAEQYRVGPEDVVQVSVWQNAELTRIVAVRPDGFISMPLLGDVQAAGLSAVELAEAIKKRLADYVPSVEVSVTVQEINSFKVSVVGKVGRPSRYRLKSPTTVLELLAEAGGLTEFAKAEEIVVLRPVPFPAGRKTGRTFKRIPFNYKKVISLGGETENFSLEPGDILIVP